MGGRYRPPALRALASGGSPPNEVLPSITTPAEAAALPPTNYPPGFRRARAGTLPSNVQLAAQRFAAASTSLGSTPPSTDSLTEQAPRPITGAPVPSLAAPTRPGLRHATSVASSAASTATTERNSRLRSGSLTLPTGGLSNAFGPSIFSSSWLSTTNGSGNGFPVLDELRSVTSADSGADDFDVHTLDYLGLDDHRNDHRNDPRNQPQAATLSELRNQAQAAIAGNLANPSRMRATTVSNPYRSRPAATGSLLSTPAAEEEEEEEEYFDNYDELAYTRQRLNSYETSIPDGGYSSSAYVAKGFKTIDHLSTTRPRAISVSGLDEPMRSLQRRATTADVNPYVNELNQQSSGLAVLASNVGGPASILKSLASARSGSSPNVHFPSGEGTGRGVSQYLLAPSSQNRSLSPKSEGPSSQTQAPTRSLWIGNLDSAVTSEQLIHVFAPYGAIESLRLLPEKVCNPS